MTILLIAVLCFLAAAVIAGIQRTWTIMLLAIGLALAVLHDLPIKVG